MQCNTMHNVHAWIKESAITAKIELFPRSFCTVVSGPHSAANLVHFVFSGIDATRQPGRRFQLCFPKHRGLLSNPLLCGLTVNGRHRSWPKEQVSGTTTSGKQPVILQNFWKTARQIRKSVRASPQVGQFTVMYNRKSLLYYIAI